MSVVIEPNKLGHWKSNRSTFRQIEYFNTRWRHSGECVSELTLAIAEKFGAASYLPASNNKLGVYGIISIGDDVLEKPVVSFTYMTLGVDKKVATVDLQVMAVTMESRPTAQL